MWNANSHNDYQFAKVSRVYSWQHSIWNRIGLTCLWIKLRVAVETRVSWGETSKAGSHQTPARVLEIVARVIMAWARFPHYPPLLSSRARNVELGHFRRCYAERGVEQCAELPLMYDVKTFRGCHCNLYNMAITFPAGAPGHNQAQFWPES